MPKNSITPPDEAGDEERLNIEETSFSEDLDSDTTIDGQPLLDKIREEDILDEGPRPEAAGDDFTIPPSETPPAADIPPHPTGDDIRIPPPETFPSAEIPPPPTGESLPPPVMPEPSLLEQPATLPSIEALHAAARLETPDVPPLQPLEAPDDAVGLPPALPPPDNIPARRPPETGLPGGIPPQAPAPTAPGIPGTPPTVDVPRRPIGDAEPQTMPPMPPSDFVEAIPPHPAIQMDFIDQVGFMEEGPETTQFEFPNLDENYEPGQRAEIIQPGGVNEEENVLGGQSAVGFEDGMIPMPANTWDLRDAAELKEGTKADRESAMEGFVADVVSCLDNNLWTSRPPIWYSWLTGLDKNDKLVVMCMAVKNGDFQPELDGCGNFTTTLDKFGMGEGGTDGPEKEMILIPIYNAAGGGCENSCADEGECSDAQYTDEDTCEDNAGVWTPAEPADLSDWDYSSPEEAPIEENDWNLEVENGDNPLFPDNCGAKFMVMEHAFVSIGSTYDFGLGLWFREITIDKCGCITNISGRKNNTDDVADMPMSATSYEWWGDDDHVH